MSSAVVQQMYSSDAAVLQQCSAKYLNEVEAEEQQCPLAAVVQQWLEAVVQQWLEAVVQQWMEAVVQQ